MGSRPPWFRHGRSSSPCARIRSGPFRSPSRNQHHRISEQRHNRYRCHSHHLSRRKSRPKDDKKISKIQNRKQLRAELDAKNQTDQERAELLIAYVIWQLAEAYYASVGLQRCLKWRGKEGDDANEFIKLSLDCKCGHGVYKHSVVTSKELEDPKTTEWILKAIAKEVYPDLQKQTAHGRFKTKLSEIDPCRRCSCPDFDWAKGRGFISERCYCEHRWKEHGSGGDLDWKWIIGQLASVILEENGSHVVRKKKHKSDSDSSSDSSSSDSDSSDNDDDSYSSDADPSTALYLIDSDGEEYLYSGNSD
ncbi:hypothetical protein TWF694_006022 [Orbilia ellipsospora]|uniref:Uncharacterized protein n=1 Tax=Orbilia ellipsospora TaxID=2528407 RepID=A0AAV9WS29_9PEZI